MKLFLTFALSLVISISFAQTDSLTQKYENALLIDSLNAITIDSFENTPGSIVTYFYAAKIRKDGKWQEVIPKEADRSERLKHKLTTYEEWNFTQFQLVEKTEFEKNKYWIKVFFEIEYKGRKESGTDEVTVELIEGTWVITSVPT